MINTFKSVYFPFFWYLKAKHSKQAILEALIVIEYWIDEQLSIIINEIPTLLIRLQM